jgi:cytochrome c553
VSSGTTVVGLVAVVVGMALAIAGIAGYLVSESRLGERLKTPVESIHVSSDIGSIQHGQHLAGAIALCMHCHGMNMAGKVLVDDASVRIVAPNLTRGRGGVGGSLADADMARAIRYGVGPTGRWLLMMPSDDYNILTDPDLGALVAYIRSLPAIESALPANEIRIPGRLLLLTSQVMLVPGASIDWTAPRHPPPQPGLTAEYGAYLTVIAGCERCHRPDLSGGKMPGALRGSVPAANLTPAALGDWSDADFLRVMRTGRRPDDRILDASMPWQYYAQMTDLELRAIWSFLQVIPPQ